MVLSEPELEEVLAQDRSWLFFLETDGTRGRWKPRAAAASLSATAIRSGGHSVPKAIRGNFPSPRRAAGRATWYISAAIRSNNPAVVAHGIDIEMGSAGQKSEMRIAAEVVQRGLKAVRRAVKIKGIVGATTR